jgi:hypothetical protein
MSKQSGHLCFPGSNSYWQTGKQTDRQTSGYSCHTDTDMQTSWYSGHTDTDRQTDKPAGAAVTQILTDRPVGAAVTQILTDRQTNQRVQRSHRNWQTDRQTKPGGTAVTQIMTDRFTSLCVQHCQGRHAGALSDRQTSYDVIERQIYTNDKPRGTGDHADTDRLTNQKVRSQTIKCKFTQILYWQTCTLSGPGSYRDCHKLIIRYWGSRRNWQTGNHHIARVTHITDRQKNNQVRG